LTIPDYSIKSDSFFLFANYADPFIPEIDTLQQQIDNIDKQLKASENKLSSVNNTPNSYSATPIPAKPDLSFINYSGIIINKDEKNKKAGFITLRGKEIMIKEGQKIEDIQIKKMEKGRLIFLYRNKKEVIYNKTH